MHRVDERDRLDGLEIPRAGLEPVGDFAVSAPTGQICTVLPEK